MEYFFTSKYSCECSFLHFGYSGVQLGAFPFFSLGFVCNFESSNSNKRHEKVHLNRILDSGSLNLNKT